MATNAGQKIAAGVEKMEAPLRKIGTKTGTTKTRVNQSDAERLIPHGKKSIKQMSTEEFAQSLADRAEKTLGKGKGPELGTQKHKYAEKLGERYQQMTGDKMHLEFEVPYKNGRQWREGDGLKDHVKPDVYNPKTNEVFDHKFGGAKLETPQINRYQQQMPKNPDGTAATTTQIKPTF